MFDIFILDLDKYRRNVIRTSVMVASVIKRIIYISHYGLVPRENFISAHR